MVSLFFYGWGEPVYISIMLLSIAVDYTHGLLVERWRDNDRRARMAVASSVLCNLAILVFFKYPAGEAHVPQLADGVGQQHLLGHSHREAADRKVGAQHPDCLASHGHLARRWMELPAVGPVLRGVDAGGAAFPGKAAGEAAGRPMALASSTFLAIPTVKRRIPEVNFSRFSSRLTSWSATVR